MDQPDGRDTPDTQYAAPEVDGRRIIGDLLRAGMNLLQGRESRPALQDLGSHHRRPASKALSGLVTSVAALGICEAPTHGAEAGSFDCKTIKIDKLTADTSALSSESNLVKLRHDVYQSVSVSGNAPRPDELVAVGRVLAEATAKWATTKKISDVVEIERRLTVGMQRACSTLTDTTKSAGDAVVAALNEADLPAPPSSEYYFFLGSVNSLQAQGGFASNLEASLLSRTSIAGLHQLEAPRRLSGWAKEGWTTDGVFELTYAKIGAVASPPTPAQNAGTNPFTSASGILRGNLALEQTFFRQNVGSVGGVGFTSRTSSTQGTTTRLSPRFFVGFMFLADYGALDNPDHATGRVLAGYARDKFWQPTDSSDTSSPNQPNRLFIDGRIDTPGIFNSKSVKFSFQIFADAPAANHGPADVRLSLLISADLQSLLGIK